MSCMIVMKITCVCTCSMCAHRGPSLEWQWCVPWLCQVNGQVIHIWTTVSGIRILWDCTTFNSSASNWEMAKNVCSFENSWAVPPVATFVQNKVINQMSDVNNKSLRLWCSIWGKRRLRSCWLEENVNYMCKLYMWIVMLTLVGRYQTRIN